jgi:hypothetical protein
MTQESKDQDLDLPALEDTSLDSASSFRNVNSNVSPFTIPMEHILAIFLNQTSNSPIHSALAENHIFDAYDLVGLTHQEINTLMYTDTNGKKQPLTLGWLKLLNTSEILLSTAIEMVNKLFRIMKILTQMNFLDLRLPMLICCHNLVPLPHRHLIIILLLLML